MTSEFINAILLAAYLGIFTSINPCPLVTNIAAISYVAKSIDRPFSVFLSGLLYTLGRTFTYTILGFLLVKSFVSNAEISNFLQDKMYIALGPFLILTGMILLDMLQFSFKGFAVSDKMQKKVSSSGILGAGLLGIVFALSFCPLSAALFFLTLIPLAIKHNSSIILPGVYGIGTAIPVVIFALLIAFSAKSDGSAFNKLTKIEIWVRRLSGVLFIIFGFHYCLKYIFLLY